MSDVVEILEQFILLYFLCVNSFYGLVLLAAGAEMRRHRREVLWEQPSRLLGAKIYPRISFLSPAHNEEANVCDSVRALLNHHYPEIEVVVIDDGSKDRTMEVLIEQFDLVEVEPTYSQSLPNKPIRGLYRSARTPNLLVASKDNGGKSDALNLGLQLASGELTCVVDADTLLNPDALQKLVRPFLAGDEVIAAGGCLRVVNGSVVEQARVVEVRTSRSWLAGIQTVEYIRAFFLGRLGLNRLGGNLIISGAFGLFRRKNILQAGGYATNTVGEDMELVVRMRRLGMEQGHPSLVDFIPDPVAWTEAPPNLNVLIRQRDRWQRGLCDSLWRHRQMCFNPAYDSAGLLAFPYQFIVELVSPLVEAMGLILLTLSLLGGMTDYSFALGFFAAAYGYGTVLTMLAIILEERCFSGQRQPRDQAWLMVWALLECVGYRQVALWARLLGIGRWLMGRSDWGRMDRVGFGRPEGRPIPPNMSEVAR